MLSLLERGGNDSIALQHSLERATLSQIATTIISYEEQMRGWLAVVARADTSTKLVAAYARLQTFVEVFSSIPILPFDNGAALLYDELRKSNRRVGPMDLKIAAIAYSNQATVLTRNTRHFETIPNLRVEDWSQ